MRDSSNTLSCDPRVLPHQSGLTGWPACPHAPLSSSSTYTSIINTMCSIHLKIAVLQPTQAPSQTWIPITTPPTSANAKCWLQQQSPTQNLSPWDPITDSQVWGQLSLSVVNQTMGDEKSLEHFPATYLSKVELGDTGAPWKGHRIELHFLDSYWIHLLSWMFLHFLKAGVMAIALDSFKMVFLLIQITD